MTNSKNARQAVPATHRALTEWNYQMHRNTTTCVSEPISQSEPINRAIKKAALRLWEILAAESKLEVIHAAIRFLAAKQRQGEPGDGEGFSLPHIQIGLELADEPQLTPNQAALARRYLYRYRQQLPPSLLAACFGDVPMADLKREMS